MKPLLCRLNLHLWTYDFSKGSDKEMIDAIEKNKEANCKCARCGEQRLIKGFDFWWATTWITNAWILIRRQRGLDRNEE